MGTLSRSQQSLLDIINRFSSNTSAHGPSKFVAQSKRWVKLFWAALFFAGLGMVVYAIVVTLETLYTYPTATSVEILTDTLNYPAVTVCNMNAYRSSKLGTIPGMRKAINKLASKKNASFSVATMSISSAPPTTTGRAFNITTIPKSTIAKERALAASIDQSDDVRPIKVDYVKYTWFDSAGGTSVDSQIKKNFTKLLQPVSLKRKQAMGYQLVDMLQECKFAGISCTPLDFAQFYNRKYGNCFTFNSGYKGGVLKVTKGGHEYGLSMMLLVDQTEYLGVLAQQAGVVIAVHRQGTHPFPEDHVTFVPPGYRASVSINYVNVTRPPTPYTDCTDGAGIEMYYPGNYTREGCRKTCLQKHIFKTCNCGDSALPIPLGKHYCVTKAEEKCVEKTVARYKSGELRCDECTSLCSDASYTTSVSMAEWPAKTYMSVLLSTLSSRLNLANVLTNGSDIRKHMCFVNVYFSRLSYTWYDEEPSYLVHNALSDIGGQMGLWIGISVISVGELVELAMEVIYFLCYRFYRRHTGKPSNVPSRQILVATSNPNETEEVTSAV